MKKVHCYIKSSISTNFKLKGILKKTSCRRIKIRQEVLFISKSCITFNRIQTKTGMTLILFDNIST